MGKPHRFTSEEAKRARELQLFRTAISATKESNKVYKHTFTPVGRKNSLIPDKYKNPWPIVVMESIFAGIALGYLLKTFL